MKRLHRSNGRYALPCGGPQKGDSYTIYKPSGMQQSVVSEQELSDFGYIKVDLFKDCAAEIERNGMIKTINKPSVEDIIRRYFQPFIKD